MKLEFVDAVCRAGGAHNEDIWGTTPQAAWILDGATGLWPHNRFGGVSEAAWLVRFSDAALRRRLLEEPCALSTSDLIAEVAREAAQAARDLCDDLTGVASHELPSASLAMIRVCDEALELANLGDCAVVWRDPQAGAQRFGSSGVAALDARLEAAIADALAAGRTFAEARAAALPLIHAHRRLMNQPGGYWIHDLSGLGAAHVQTRRVDLQAGADLLLMTDGFYRLVETYGRYDYEGLLTAAAARGLESLYDELREIEAADPECRAYPRGKPQDDAAAALLRLA